MSQLSNGPPGCLTPLDSKIVQYNYGLLKLKSLQTSVRSPPPNGLALCNYVVLLFGNLFAINEAAFAPKLEALANFQIPKLSPINVTPAVSHVAYDNNDGPVTPLTALPSPETARRGLKVLDALINLAVQGYDKRLEAALKEKGAGAQDYNDTIVRILRTEVFGDNAVDLQVPQEMWFPLTDDKSELSDQNYIEATLIDIDLRMVFVICNGYRQSLQALQTVVDKFKLLKSSAKKESYMKSMKEPAFLMHKIVALTIRLNDMYSVLRKFGRKVYLSNVLHLNSQKLLSQGSNPTFFKLQLLKSMDDLFNTTKKNGVLIANLTRLVRQNSRYEVNTKNLLDFSNFVNQGFILVDTTVTKFEDFGSTWLSTELRFRNAYSLPKKTLFEAYQKVQQDYAKHNETTAKTAPKTIASIPEPFPSTEVAKTLRKLDLNESIISGRARSSSNSSVSSTSSNTRPVRRSSINSANRNSVLLTSPPKVTPATPKPRPNSMIYLNHSSSVSSLPSKAAEASASASLSATTTTPTGRRRSNSQPQPSPDAIQPLGSLRSPSGSIRSPSGSIRRAAGNRGTSSPTPAGKVYNAMIPEEEDPPISSASAAAAAASKLTANQRLQLHLRQAAKSGNLFTQEKEIMSHVVYDPNAPQGTTITKRYAEVPKPEPKAPKEPEVKDESHNTVAASAGAASALKSAAPARRTRDQVTKLNTKRNSELLNAGSKLSPNSSIQSSATSQSGSGNTEVSEASSTISDTNTIIKRVRFAGVPEYTEAEDAPTKYSAKILKNFAMFRSPGLSNPIFKRKDQILKKEESISFKTQLHSQPPNGLSTPLQGNKLSRLRDKLI